MNQSRSKRVKAKRDKPQTIDNFYETMPLSAMPHAVYRDDDDSYEHTHDDANLSLERAETSHRITALITLGVLALVAIGLITVIAYSLATLNDAAAPAQSTLQL